MTLLNTVNESTFKIASGLLVGARSWLQVACYRIS